MRIMRIIPALAVTALLLATTATTSVAAETFRYCGAAYTGLAVRANDATRCQFAKATANAYLRKIGGGFGFDGPKRRTVRPYSSALRRRVRMHCRIVTSGENPYALCKGGNGSKVGASICWKVSWKRSLSSRPH